MPDGSAFAQQVAVVTGSGGGIGAAIAATLASRGARVVVNDLEAEVATSGAEKIVAAGGAAIGVAADASVPEHVDRLMAEARRAFGEIDILVNNAARTDQKAFLDHTVDDWDRTIATNLRGPFLCTRAVLPAMIKGRRGSVVNIVSIAGLHTTTPHVAYAASKAGLIAMTRDVAVEVAPFGVRVNAVAPGPVDSHNWGMDAESLGVPYVRAGLPGDIANAVAFLASDEASYVVGETLVVSGGANLKVGRY
jgi:NAD(P)-dependent dehydrogenase (short-subunit alcohol dehydrogenase family)